MYNMKLDPYLICIMWKSLLSFLPHHKGNWYFIFYEGKGLN